jgi:predicted permease
MGEFASTFGIMFKAMVQLLLIAVLAGLLVRRKWVTQDQVKVLAVITVNILLPCMIFSNIVKTFHPAATPGWWGLPILGVGISLAGLAMGWLLFRRELPRKNLMLAMASLHNSGYMALPLAKMAYPEQFDRFAMLTFLFILGYSPMLWSVGKRLCTTVDNAGSIGQPLPGAGWRGFITPPFVANIASVLLVLVGLAGFIPAVAVDSLDMLGEATVPIATFVLGATVGSITLTRLPAWSDAARAIGIKLVLLPALMITVLGALKAWTTVTIDPLMGNFLVIQSATAPATALALQVRKYGGDEQLTGGLLFISYLLCTLTLPLWLGVWGALAP